MLRGLSEVRRRSLGLPDVRVGPEGEVASGSQRKRRAMSGLSQIAEFERRPARGRNQKSNFARATDPPRGDLRCPIYNRVYKGLSLTDRI